MKTASMKKDAAKIEGEADTEAPSQTGVLVRVLRYGLLPPHEGAAFVEEQMRLGHRYRNDLTEIERGRREAIRQAERAVPGVREAEEAYDVAVKAFLIAKDAMKAARAAARRRSETDEQKDAFAKAKAVLDEAGQRLSKARARARRDPSVLALRAIIDGEKTAERGEKGGLTGRAKRGARALSRVAWGVYSRVEARMDASRKALDKGGNGRPGGLYDGLDPNDPRFVRWSRDGFVGAQQLTDGGITVAEIFSGSDSRVRIGGDVRVRSSSRWEGAAYAYSSIADDAAQRTRPSTNKKVPRTLSIRLGKGEMATWCSWPMMYHRPIPPDATVKEVVVHRKMRGDREEWYATITVQISDDARVRASSGAVAVDLGWRKLEDGAMRVGTWQGSDGETGEIRLTARTVSALQKAKGIQAVRDRGFDEIRTTLLDWWKTPVLRDVPEWLAEALQHLHQWKSKERLQRLVLRWKRERFAGDEQGFAAAEAWRYRDYHLWRYEEGSRQRALRFRREQYRIESKRLAARYRTVVLETFNLSKMAARPDIGDDDETGDDDAPRAQRQLVAPSDFRNCLIQAFAEVAQVPAKNTTRTCNVCGVVHPFDAKKNIWREPACPECGATWDQDVNAAVNMLRAWRDAPPPAERTAKSRPVGSRFERARQAAEQREKSRNDQENGAETEAAEE